METTDKLDLVFDDVVYDNNAQEVFKKSSMRSTTSGPPCCKVGNSFANRREGLTQNLAWVVHGRHEDAGASRGSQFYAPSAALGSPTANNVIGFDRPGAQ